MNFIFNVLARLLPTKTVDQLVAGATKLIDGLQAAEQAQNDRAIKLDAEIARMTAESSVAKIEAERARRVRENLAQLVA